MAPSPFYFDGTISKRFRFGDRMSASVFVIVQTC